MDKRTSKEFYIETNTAIKSVLGTINKHDPKILYVRSKAKLCPTIYKKDYSDEIKSIKRDFNNFASKLISKSNTFDNKCIVNFDLGEYCLSYNKKSFFKYDIFLKPNTIKNLLLQQNDVKYIVNNLNEKLLQLFKNKGITCN